MTHAPGGFFVSALVVEGIVEVIKWRKDLEPFLLARV